MHTSLQYWQAAPSANALQLVVTGQDSVCIWYVVVRPTRLLIVCGEQSPPHSGEVSNATPYLHSKELGGQEHGGTKPVEAVV